MVILGAATADTAVVRLASGLGCRGQLRRKRRRAACYDPLVTISSKSSRGRQILQGDQDAGFYASLSYGTKASLCAWMGRTRPVRAALALPLFSQPRIARSAELCQLTVGKGFAGVVTHRARRVRVTAGAVTAEDSGHLRDVHTRRASLGAVREK